MHNGKVDFNSGRLLVPYNNCIWYVNDGKMRNCYYSDYTAMPCKGKWYIIRPTDEELKTAIENWNPFIEFSQTWKYHEQYVEQSKLCRQKVKKYDYVFK